jgi:hypothetical protein
MGGLPRDDFDAKIMAILDKSPFESTRSIPETICVDLVTVLWRLHDSVDFRLFHLHWVPQILIVRLCEKRMEYAQAILLFLHVAERDSWHHLVTGDELLLFLDTSPCRIWTLSRDDVITKPRHDIQSKLFMFTIIWNPTASMLLTSSQMITKWTATIL